MCSSGRGTAQQKAEIWKAKDVLYSGSFQFYFWNPLYLSSLLKKKSSSWEFPGGPLVRTSQFPCQGPGVQSLVGELRSQKPHGAAKKRKAGAE